MNERTEEPPGGPADQLSDRDAGRLLVAFLVAVILVLAVGTLH